MASIGRAGPRTNARAAILGDGDRFASIGQRRVTEWQKTSTKLPESRPQLFDAESYCFKILQNLEKLPCTMKEAGFIMFYMESGGIC